MLPIGHVAITLLFLLQPLGSSDRNAGLPSNCCSTTHSTPAAVMQLHNTAMRTVCVMVSMITACMPTQPWHAIVVCTRDAILLPLHGVDCSSYRAFAQCVPRLRWKHSYFAIGLVLMGCHTWNIKAGARLQIILLGSMINAQTV